MSWIFVDKEEGGGSMRQHMRRAMRKSYRSEGYYPMMRHEDWDEAYRQGYKHGYEDSEDDDMEMRRGRDSRGRYV